jgi:Fe-S oxidoreductase
MSESLNPGREVFRNLSPAEVALFYGLAAAALAVFGGGLWARIRKYRRGRPAAGRLTLGRLGRGLVALVSHAPLRRGARGAGWAHLGIFWGFVALFVGTLIIMVDYDVLRPLEPAWRFWRGRFYLWYSAVLDVMGVLFVVGLLAMAGRRWGRAPAALDYTRPDRAPGAYDRRGYRRDDALFLGLLLGLGVSGYLVEGFRIAADRPPWEPWSPVGWALADLLDGLGLTVAAADRAHRWGWWVHAVLALGFVAYLPYSKALHMVVDVANVLMRDATAGRRLPTPAAEGASVGYATLDDLTWKELLDLDACTKCGRCHVACPARAAGAPLSPRDLVLELREQAEATLGGRSWLREAAPRGGDGPLLGTALRPETLWACTTCLACMESCPVGIEHVPLIVQFRRRLVSDGALDPGLQTALERVARYGNSFGQPERARGRWTRGLEFAVKDARREPVEYLWFVGDYASFDPALQALTRGVARLFHAAGVDFGILYEGERNAGNDVRRAGEEGLYQLLVERNAAALARARFRAVVTTDPHTYNTLRFEYPAFGAAYPVYHHTELLWQLVQQGRLAVRPLDAVVTYHDPCYLARYAGLTEPPRQLLRALGLRLVEMRRHGRQSFCCGAGGGRIWMTDSRVPGVPTAAEQRIAEALELPGVQYFVVACPKDVTMYRDAVKTAGAEGRIAVKEISELVTAALGARLDPAHEVLA